MQRVITFLKETWQELRGMDWPERSYAMRMVRLVFVTLVIFSLFFGLVDYVLFLFVDALF